MRASPLRLGSKAAQVFLFRLSFTSNLLMNLMLSWQLYTQLFREMENENAEYVCIDYDNKVASDNDFEPETHCKN